MDWLLYSWPTLILLGIALRMALRLTYGARGADADDALYVFLNINSWVLLGLGIVPAAILGLVTLIGAIVVLLGITTFFEAVIQRRAAQRRSICTLLALLIERGAQLDAPMLLSGQSTGGIVGRSASNLLEALQSGVPLLKAVARYRAALPREARAYLAAGSSTSAQLAALRELRRSEQDELASVRRALVDRITYLTSVMIVMGGSLAFIMIKIMPEFEQVFSEFSLELPALTQLSVTASAIFADYLAVPLLWCVGIVVLVVLLVATCYLFEVRVLSWLTDRLFRGRATADVLRILAIAVEETQPLDEVLKRLTMVYPSGAIRRQLRPAAIAVSAGADWRDSLLRAQVISNAEHGLLYTAERVGNLPWALRTVAQRRDKRLIYRLGAVLQVLYPLAIVGLGACVGFYVVSLFVPIAKLIEGLAM